MSSEKDSKYIYAQENKLYHCYYHFGGHWENETNSLKIISFNAVRKRQQTLWWLLNIRLAAYT